jgi:hypothetical protein
MARHGVGITPTDAKVPSVHGVEFSNHEEISSMSRGGQTLRSLLVAAASVAAASAAGAAKLDKAACSDLSNELTAVKATGVKADMERGPDWAKANMPPERLESARRLMELEDQLEFRCGIRGNGGAKPRDKPDAPGVKDQPENNAAEQPPPRINPPATEKRMNAAPAMLVPVFKPPVATKAATIAPAAAPRLPVAPPAVTSVKSTPATTPTVTQPAQAAPVMASNPPVAAPPAATAPVTKIGPLQSAVGAVPVPPTAPAGAKPVQAAPVMAANPPVAAPPAATAPVTVIGPLPSAARIAPTPPTTAQPASNGAVPAAKKLGDAAAQAGRKKNPRRTPTSAYVSPSDVSPYSLSGQGTR